MLQERVRMKAVKTEKVVDVLVDAVQSAVYMKHDAWREKKREKRAGKASGEKESGKIRAGKENGESGYSKRKRKAGSDKRIQID